MRLVFSEVPTDYSRYSCPYVVWAFPEGGETPADFFAHGFLPSLPTLDRFYLCRNLRVRLKEFTASTENRRILRKFTDVQLKLIPRAEFDFSKERFQGWLRFAQERFGEGIMSEARLERLMSSRVITHVLKFEGRIGGEHRELGCVLLYLESPRVAYYYYAFYDLAYFSQSLGLHMMTSTVSYFAQEGFEFLHLGTCYTESSLYKTQFAGVEFFNGVRWSSDLKELKHLVRRPKSGSAAAHLLEELEYAPFLIGGTLATHAKESTFCVTL